MVTWQKQEGKYLSMQCQDEVGTKFRVLVESNGDLFFLGERGDQPPGFCNPWLHGKRTGGDGNIRACDVKMNSVTNLLFYGKQQRAFFEKGGVARVL